MGCTINSSKLDVRFGGTIRSPRSAGEQRGQALKAERYSELIAKMKRYNKNAQIIFDSEEPIGRATDLVLPPRRRFFRRVRTNKHRSSSVLRSS
jgi:hypothetical protein